ncbi:MAG TPA: DNA-3-methyladenine glycosylase I [Roseiflexaceae bacterium]|nr:DNA-3-methyladenine glycosylase I [Roseiflexaceae bacterium]
MSNDTEFMRCGWATTDPLMVAYHDQEWGIPCHDEAALFERLMLESFQAGLSWVTILRKRENFRRAFDGWDVERVAAYTAADVERLMADTGIIRNRLKIEATIRNARCFLNVQREIGTFDRYLWSFVDGAPLQQPPPATLAAIPAQTPLSIRLSKDLRKHGFAFVGPTMCYALMQSVGMVNDHIAGCFRAAHANGS